MMTDSFNKDKAIDVIRYLISKTNQTITNDSLVRLITVGEKIGLTWYQHQLTGDQLVIDHHRLNGVHLKQLLSDKQLINNLQLVDIDDRDPLDAFQTLSMIDKKIIDYVIDNQQRVERIYHSYDDLDDQVLTMEALFANDNISKQRIDQIEGEIEYQRHYKQYVIDRLT